jgi:hypothetical protein
MPDRPNFKWTEMLDDQKSFRVMGLVELNFVGPILLPRGASGSRWLSKAIPPPSSASASCTEKAARVFRRTMARR